MKPYLIQRINIKSVPAKVIVLLSSIGKPLKVYRRTNEKKGEKCESNICTQLQNVIPADSWLIL
jgi:hypothetical protein